MKILYVLTISMLVIATALFLSNIFENTNENYTEDFPLSINKLNLKIMGTDDYPEVTPCNEENSRVYPSGFIGPIGPCDSREVNE